MEILNRKTRIVQALRAGEPIAVIAQREGLSRNYVEQLRRDNLEEIKVPEDPVGGRTLQGL